jgi:hypothetical protein
MQCGHSNCKKWAGNRPNHEGKTGLLPVRVSDRWTSGREPATHYIYVFKRIGAKGAYADIATKALCGISTINRKGLKRVGFVEQSANCKNCTRYVDYTYSPDLERKELYVWKCMVGIL